MNIEVEIRERSEDLRDEVLKTSIIQVKGL
jgi:hypothetical protein